MILGLAEELRPFLETDTPSWGSACCRTADKCAETFCKRNPNIPAQIPGRWPTRRERGRLERCKLKAAQEPVLCMKELKGHVVARYWRALGPQPVYHRPA
ncbi:unnamed protein product [Arctogadus glacialis]